MPDRSQGFATGFVLIRSPSKGRRLDRQLPGAIAPSIRAGGERRERTGALATWRANCSFYGLPGFCDRILGFIF